MANLKMPVGVDTHLAKLSDALETEPHITAWLSANPINAHGLATAPWTWRELIREILACNHIEAGHRLYIPTDLIAECEQQGGQLADILDDIGPDIGLFKHASEPEDPDEDPDWKFFAQRMD